VSDIPFFIGILILFVNLCFWTKRFREAIQSITRVPELSPTPEAPLPSPVPRISVIVPANNEEDSIRECLESVLAQTCPDLEIIVVDDRSTDTTLGIATSLAERNPNFHVIHNDFLPEGWTGKCHALRLGVSEADGEWLAFLDADCLLHPDALRTCLHTATASDVSVVTLTPKIAVRSIWDGVLMPLLAGMQYILYPLARVNDPKDPTASANGMFYLIRRSAYERIGGHEAVKDLAVEDIGIGKRVKAAGLGLVFANGRHLLETRMYDSLSGILHGWTRIFAASVNYRMRTALQHLAIHSAVSLPSVALALILTLPVVYEHLSWYASVPLAVMGIEMMVVTFLLYRGLGIPVRYAALMFLSNLMVVVSLALVVKRIVLRAPLEWRGSVYEDNRYDTKKLDPPGR
jgi:cellulose synthase/poly-beta-1,6-N-acetylglucosamine synthase-like glycosyltransferase